MEKGMTTPKIEIVPDRGLIDEPVSIRLSGFESGQHITVRAQMSEHWRSWATFVADQSGKVDLAMQKPVSGSYDETDVMGLIWSMSMDIPGDGPRSALFGPTTLEPVRITFTAETDGGTITQAVLERLYIYPEVTRQELRQNGLFGILFVPPGAGPHPVVILLSGSGGGLQEQRAALFASRGYAALALAYFNYETLPAELVEIPLEYFETAIQWLQTQEVIDGDRIAAAGWSRGGELSLLLGATFPQIKVIIAYVPSAVAWGGISAKSEGTRAAAWTHRGKAIPYLPAVDTDNLAEDFAELVRKGEPLPLAPKYLASLDDTTAVEAAIIPVEKTNGAILLISGEDDQMWPSAKFSQMIMDWLDQHNFPHRYRHLSYEGAGHTIGTPYVPTTIHAAFHPVRKHIMSFGGTAKGNAHAMTDSWQQVLRFLEETL
jgi:dienelactone hydrolase